MPEKQRRKNKDFSRIIKSIIFNPEAIRRTDIKSIVGFTREDLMTHLEKLFQPGMSFENLGEWEIDHIKPVSSFRFESYYEDSFTECWKISNLQPLWKKDNMAKGGTNRKSYHEINGTGLKPIKATEEEILKYKNRSL